jgi:thiol-disulfide isomerase/thioredoxin
LLLGLASVALGANVVDLADHPIDPLKAAHGKPLVLVFLRIDCPISNRYAPEIQRLAREFERRADFWLVYTGRVQTPAAISKQLSEYGYHIPAIRDTDGELARLTQAQVTPEAAVFNGSGKLAYHGRIDNWYEDFGRARNVATSHELEQAVSAVIKNEPPVHASVPGIGCSIADLE